MAKARATWDGRRIPGRRLIPLLLVASLAPAAMPAQADQQVSGVIGSTMGVALDATGSVAAGGTEPVSVTREWRGPTLVVTVAPR